MEKMERDPRKDPKVGDAVLNGRFLRTVYVRCDETIRYRRRCCDFTGYANTCSIKRWLKWAKNAKVIHHAE